MKDGGRGDTEGLSSRGLRKSLVCGGCDQGTLEQE